MHLPVEGNDTCGAADGALSADVGPSRTFRKANERIETLNLEFEPLLPLGDWLCECPDCLETIALTASEFAAIRRSPDRVVVKPGHEQALPGAVIEATDRYAVVALVADPPTTGEPR